MIYNEADVLTAVTQIAASYDVPLGTDVSVMLANGRITVIGEQQFFGAQIRTVVVVSMSVANCEPVATILIASINDEELDSGTVAELQAQISAGFASFLKTNLNYSCIESINVNGGQMIVVYQ